MRDFCSELPLKVRLTAEADPKGRAWLAGLNATIGTLEQRWSIEVGELAKRGTEAFCAAARTAEGKDLYIKLVIAGIDPARQEMRVLRAANGQGYAKLLRADEGLNAMLIERLGQQLHEFGFQEAKRIAIICSTLAVAWRTQREDMLLTTGAEKADEFLRIIEQLWLELGKPVPITVLARARECAARRKVAFDPAKSVLAHGDAHEWNTLAVPGSATAFKFVDPDGVFAEPAFDLAVSMREWSEVVPSGDRKALGRARCRLLSDVSGVNEASIWDWAFLHCLSNGFGLKKEGHAQGAAVQIGMAEAWADGDWWR